MDPFPTELWDLIIRHLKPQDMLTVATTCHFLHTVAEPWIYRNVTFKSNAHSAADQFFRSLAARPSLGELIRTLAIPKQQPPPQISSQIALQQLALFSNILDLKLLGPNVDSTLLSTLFNMLPRLRVIRFFQPTIVGNLVIPHEDTPNTRAMSLNSFYITGWSLTYPIDSLLPYLTHHGYNHTLTTLKIGRYKHTPHALLPFLLSTPSLLHLSIHSSAPTPSHPIHTLPRDAIPLLKHFAGVAQFIAIFVPGRPVASVKLLTSNGDADDVLRTLGQSSVPVTVLNLDDPGRRLCYAPRTLRRLIWGSAWTDQLLTSLPDWAPMPHLKHMSGVLFGPPDQIELSQPVEVKETIVRAVTAAYPSLKECVFRSLDQDRRERDVWVKMPEGEWERRVRSAE